MAGRKYLPLHGREHVAIEKKKVRGDSLLRSDHKTLYIRGQIFSERMWEFMRGFVIGFFIVISLFMPFAGAVDPAGAGPGGEGSIGPEFNATGVDIANSTIPPGYAVTPSLIDVRVEVSGTDLQGAKGEMAAGPRSIGFMADPASLVLVIIVVMVISAGILYLVKRKPAEPGADDAEETDDQ
jgi:hypothetical protein